MSFISTEFHKILIERFRRSCANKKKQDWLTDWLMDGSKTLYTPQLVAWGITNHIQRDCFSMGIQGKSYVHTYPQILLKIETKNGRKIENSYWVKLKLNIIDTFKHISLCLLLVKCKPWKILSSALYIFATLIHLERI